MFEPLCFHIYVRMTNYLSDKIPLQTKSIVDSSKEAILVYFTRWSYIKSASILLTLTLLIIPKADAVDALKTVSCLLKECRYLMQISLIRNSFHLCVHVYVCMHLFGC